MPRPAQVKAIAAIAALALLAVFALQGRAAVSLEELQRRIETSAPRWANYQEDIKGQIGAAPAAEWEGKPISARIDGANLRVEFEIAGPWEARELALPLLAHDPLGNTYQNTAALFEGARVTYVFTLAEVPARGTLPWVEIKYPHRERRLVFSDTGVWEAASAGVSNNREEGK